MTKCAKDSGHYPVKPRARDVRVQELTHHGQKVIERYQQCLAQRHSQTSCAGVSVV